MGLKLEVCQKCWRDYYSDGESRTPQGTPIGRAVRAYIRHRKSVFTSNQLNAPLSQVFGTVQPPQETDVKTDVQYGSGAQEKEPEEVDITGFVLNMYTHGIMHCPSSLSESSSINLHTHTAMPPPRCCPFEYRVLHLEEEEGEEGD